MQYLLEEIINSTVFPNHILLVWQKFDSIIILIKKIVRNYFFNKKKLSVRAQINKQGQDLES